MIRAALVEDDPKALERLSDYLEQYNSSEQAVDTVTAECFSDGVQFLDAYRFQFDIVFMDIEMPYADGLRVAEELRKRDKAVILIFVTMMAQYAIRGYEVSAYGFLVKPVQYADFSTLLSRAIKRRRADTERTYLTVIQGYSARRIATDELLYVSVTSHKLSFHMLDETVEIWGNLRDYEPLLERQDFVRCNSYLLVNMKYVRWVKGTEVMVGTEALQISQSRKKEFLAKTTEYLTR